MAAMLDRPFPFAARAATMAAMAVEVHRDASLALRERNGIVRVRVNWPGPGAGDAPPVLVFLSDADVRTDVVDRLCRALCAESHMVVLSVRTACPDTALTALEWTADHATQLEADPDAVLVGGIGRGAALAATVARTARDNGWPELAGQVLLPAPATSDEFGPDRRSQLVHDDHEEPERRDRPDE
jgi:acetyl esterase/lipase